MRKPFLIFLISSIILLSLTFILINKQEIISPIGTKILEKPLEKYTFPNLKKTVFPISEITLGEIIKQTDSFTSQIFYFQSFGKKASGLINIPQKKGVYPIIVMFRGFVPKEIYKPGVGTERAGEVFAANGFITLAPDFLGYGKSDNPSIDSIEERFQTYTTALTLLSSLTNLNSGLSASYSGVIKADISKVGIWGHSNGGHIALSVLAISGMDYPTVLWAPVSKPFPYSILYFTDDFDDHGKALRKVLATFEKNYDVEKYSPSNFYNFIKAPLQIHQGENDEAVPRRWSDQLADALKKLGKNIEYFIYPSSDHNLSPNGWSEAVTRSISFYKTRGL